MLPTPEPDPERMALDRAVAEAVRARLAAGPHPTPEVEAIALRRALAGLSPAEAAAARCVLGRLDSASGGALTVWGPASQVLASDRFGLTVRMAATPEAALAAARKSGRALMDLTAASAWWGRLLAEPRLRVVGALPDYGHGLPRALLIQSANPGPTGNDRTFWVTDSPWTDARIVRRLGAAGRAAHPQIAAGGVELLVVAGGVTVDDARLTGAPGDLSGVIGAAPLF